LPGIQETVAATRARAAAYNLSHLITVGAVAGLVGGFTFILANMIYAVATGLPAIAPFAAIGTVFFFDDMPQMTPEYIITGLVTHFGNSILFGIIFSLLVPLFSNIKALVVGGLAYGLLLYVVNFLVLGSLIFKFFSPFVAGGPNQVYELIIHPLTYGLVLTPFFMGLVRRLGSAPAAHAVAEEGGTLAAATGHRRAPAGRAPSPRSTSHP
jgi:uncharacterized membrane protein YagU involved in acid resistance